MAMINCHDNGTMISRKAVQCQECCNTAVFTPPIQLIDFKCVAADYDARNGIWALHAGAYGCVFLLIKLICEQFLYKPFYLSDLFQSQRGGYNHPDKLSHPVKYRVRIELSKLSTLI